MRDEAAKARFYHDVGEVGTVLWVFLSDEIKAFMMLMSHYQHTL